MQELNLELKKKKTYIIDLKKKKTKFLGFTLFKHKNKIT